DDVYRREEPDPDDVDEVPVDRSRLDGEMATRGELALQRSVEADRVEEDTAGHMGAVEAGEREEDRGEDPVARQEPEARVLVALADEEERAEHDRRDEPVAERAAVALLDGVHRART